jgi:glycerophosphoryl diester phosphodiesterase
VWTVDDVDDIDLVVRLGVDAIITNRPRVVLERLQTDGRWQPRAEGQG